MSENVTLAVMVFTAVGCGVLLLALLWEWFSERRRSRDITSRLQGMTKGERTPGGDPFGDLFREGEAKDMKWLQPVVTRLPHTRDLQHMLDQADMNWQVGTYLLVTIGVATATGLVTLLLLRIPYIAITVAGFSATLPYMYVRRRKTKRLRKFEEHFPESIDLLGRAIRAGHAFSTGLQLVAEEAPQPIGMEFRRVFEEQKFGLSLEDSLLALADRIELMDMRIFVTAVMIQREVGG
ncbi:MAG TPA: type II secretion system F family protein, partial [Gemmatimonadota bacterium]|nr:type II secretion system F family protein [Gemmatimonadota bacterium]